MDVSKLLGIMNNAGAASGASVQYKRRSEDGSVVFDTDEKDMERADFQLKMAQLARMVEHLPRKEKLAFSTQMRQKGNLKYAEKVFEEAEELYMQSLVGLDFGGGDDSSLAEARTAVQVPVLCNLAACALHTRKFLRCVLLCDIAIGLETETANKEQSEAGGEEAATPPTPPPVVSPVLWKAHSRKGAAQLELGDFSEARASLREAAAVAPSEASQKAVRCELRRLHEAEKKHKASNQKQRAAFSKAMDRGDSLYDGAPKTRAVSTLHEALSTKTRKPDAANLDYDKSSLVKQTNRSDAVRSKYSASVELSATAAADNEHGLSAYATVALKMGLGLYIAYALFADLLDWRREVPGEL